MRERERAAGFFQSSLVVPSSFFFFVTMVVRLARGLMRTRLLDLIAACFKLTLLQTLAEVK
jgi:hypothetical protein